MNSSIFLIDGNVLALKRIKSYQKDTSTGVRCLLSVKIA
jgi:hypothetical protein